MNKAFKYRIYPTDKQKDLFARTFGCCRKIWNLMLNERETVYKTEGKTCRPTPAKYKNEYPYLREVDSLALANVQLDLEKAYKNFFKVKGTGHPKYKSKKNSKQAYTTNNQNGTIRLDKEHGTIRLPKAGCVKVKLHRIPDEGWVIKSATVSRNSDNKYYVSVLFEFEEPDNPYIADTKNAIGLDYASDGLYVDNNGNIGCNHKYYRESHDKLAKAQRKLSRMKGSKKGEQKSQNYLKQLARVGKIHRHIANQRLDNLHKLSTEIANQYDVVCVESLNMKNMSNKGFGNGKATLDNGYGLFLTLLDYKLAERNKYLIKVDKWFPSSQMCHCCGSLHPEMKDLKLRMLKCDCGMMMSRDQNAAINILKEGLRILRESA